MATQTRSLRPSLEPRLTPPLKWAGGKRWLVPHLKPLWELHSQRRLVEPFCGGLAITLGLNPTRALLNDINPHLMNFYHWVQRGLQISFPMKNDQDLYYEYRRHFNQLLQEGLEFSQEAASLFYYLNRTGYNGLCRFNNQGGFNVPFGKYKTINYLADFCRYQEIFNSWIFDGKDFEDLPLTPTDFIYADPPYDVPFRQYVKGGFAWEDQVRTAIWLAQHPGPVLLSNQATSRIIDLYQQLHFQLIFLPSPRMISCTGDRAPALEVLASRNLEQECLLNLSRAA